MDQRFKFKLERLRSIVRRLRVSSLITLNSSTELSRDQLAVSISVIAIFYDFLSHPKIPMSVLEDSCGINPTVFKAFFSDAFYLHKAIESSVMDIAEEGVRPENVRFARAISLQLSLVPSPTCSPVQDAAINLSDFVRNFVHFYETNFSLFTTKKFAFSERERSQASETAILILRFLPTKFAIPLYFGEEFLSDSQAIMLPIPTKPIESDFYSSDENKGMFSDSKNTPIKVLEEEILRLEKSNFPITEKKRQEVPSMPIYTPAESKKASQISKTVKFGSSTSKTSNGVRSLTPDVNETSKKRTIENLIKGFPSDVSEKTGQLVYDALRNVKEDFEVEYGSVIHANESFFRSVNKCKKDNLSNDSPEKIKRLSSNRKQTNSNSKESSVKNPLNKKRTFHSPHKIKRQLLRNSSQVNNKTPEIQSTPPVVRHSPSRDEKLVSSFNSKSQSTPAIVRLLSSQPNPGNIIYQKKPKSKVEQNEQISSHPKHFDLQRNHSASPSCICKNSSNRGHSTGLSSERETHFRSSNTNTKKTKVVNIQLGDPIIEVNSIVKEYINGTNSNCNYTFTKKDFSKMNFEFQSLHANSLSFNAETNKCDSKTDGSKLKNMKENVLRLIQKNSDRSELSNNFNIKLRQAIELEKQLIIFDQIERREKELKKIEKEKLLLEKEIALLVKKVPE